MYKLGTVSKGALYCSWTQHSMYVNNPKNRPQNIYMALQTKLRMNIRVYLLKSPFPKESVIKRTVYKKLILLLPKNVSLKLSHETTENHPKLF